MNNKIYSCVKGTCIDISEVNDPIFSSKAMGDGVAIIPKDDIIKSPIEGTVSMVFNTKHAVGLITDDGIEVMIHVGIDTVNLQGKHFETLVEAGNRVKVGDPLLKCDFKKIQVNYDITTMLIVTNVDTFESVELHNVGKSVSEKDNVITVKHKLVKKEEKRKDSDKKILENNKSEKKSSSNKKGGQSKILAWLQMFGRSLMLPIATIAAVGILYGFTAALSRPQVADMLPFMSNEYISYFLMSIRGLSGKVFDLIPVLFSISIALGLAKREKEIAAMAGFIGYYVMLWSSSFMLSSGLYDFGTVGLGSPLGIANTLEIGAVGGMISGILTAYLHNKYYKIQLPVAIAFFSGKRFVAIAVIVMSFLLGQVLPFIWMPISSAINGVGMAISNLGEVGIFIYGSLERLLIPTGLHHILNGIFRTTAAGGVFEGVEGVWNIFFQFFETNSINDLKDFTAFMAQGKIPYMVFGLPAAALGIYHATPVAKRVKVKPLLIAGTLASITTGITEPLEFAFLFIAPLLFVIHSLLAGLSFLLMSLLEVGIGNTQGGLIDLVVYGILVPNSNWIYTVILGVAYSFIYYFLFKLYFKKKNLVLDTGNDDEIEENIENNISTEERFTKIISGLGGVKNIDEINNCFTRLRVDVKDMTLINENELKQTGSMGVKIISDTHIQVIYGPQVDNIASQLKELI